jgi:hypothetical protein
LIDDDMMVNRTELGVDRIPCGSRYGAPGQTGTPVAAGQKSRDCEREDQRWILPEL